MNLVFILIIAICFSLVYLFLEDFLKTFNYIKSYYVNYRIIRVYHGDKALKLGSGLGLQILKDKIIIKNIYFSYNLVKLFLATYGNRSFLEMLNDYTGDNWSKILLNLPLTIEIYQNRWPVTKQQNYKCTVVSSGPSFRNNELMVTQSVELKIQQKE